MPDIHAHYGQDLVAPPNNGEAINYGSGDQTFTNTTTWIYISATGDLVLTMAGGGNLTFENIPVGFHRIRATHAIQSGSTATGLALW